MNKEIKSYLYEQGMIPEIIDLIGSYASIPAYLKGYPNEVIEAVYYSFDTYIKNEVIDLSLFDNFKIDFKSPSLEDTFF